MEKPINGDNLKEIAKIENNKNRKDQNQENPKAQK